MLRGPKLGNTEWALPCSYDEAETLVLFTVSVVAWESL